MVETHQDGMIFFGGLRKDSFQLSVVRGQLIVLSWVRFLRVRWGRRYWKNGAIGFQVSVVSDQLRGGWKFFWGCGGENVLNTDFADGADFFWV